MKRARRESGGVVTDTTDNWRERQSHGYEGSQALPARPDSPTYYLKIQSLQERKHSASITKITWLVLCKENRFTLRIIRNPQIHSVEKLLNTNVRGRN